MGGLVCRAVYIYKFVLDHLDIEPFAEDKVFVLDKIAVVCGSDKKNVICFLCGLHYCFRVFPLAYMTGGNGI